MKIKTQKKCQIEAIYLNLLIIKSLFLLEKPYNNEKIYAKFYTAQPIHCELVILCILRFRTMFVSF